MLNEVLRLTKNNSKKKKKKEKVLKVKEEFRLYNFKYNKDKK